MTLDSPLVQRDEIDEQEIGRERHLGHRLTSTSSRIMSCLYEIASNKIWKGSQFLIFGRISLSLFSHGFIFSFDSFGEDSMGRRVQSVIDLFFLCFPLFLLSLHHFCNVGSKPKRTRKWWWEERERRLTDRFLGSDGNQDSFLFFFLWTSWSSVNPWIKARRG